MYKIYWHSERYFEKLTSAATSILGNSITFILALLAVIFWLTDRHHQDLHSQIGDIILSVTFLSLFIIQKTNNHLSASLHLKLNELIASHEPASNTIINVESKTELEIVELSKEYTELAEQLKELKKDTK